MRAHDNWCFVECVIVGPVDRPEDCHWRWKLRVWNPHVTIQGNHKYASKVTARRAALRVARQYGIRIQRYRTNRFGNVIYDSARPT